MWTAIVLALSGFAAAITLRFFPKKTSADTKLEVMTENNKILAAEAEAKAKAPTKLSELIKIQKAGKVSILLCLFLVGCAQQTPLSSASVCLQIRDYSPEEQLAQAEAEEQLPPDSPLIDPLLEWSGIRSELRACHATRND